MQSAHMSDRCLHPPSEANGLTEQHEQRGAAEAEHAFEDLAPPVVSIGHVFRPACSGGLEVLAHAQSGRGKGERTSQYQFRRCTARQSAYAPSSRATPALTDIAPHRYAYRVAARPHQGVDGEYNICGEQPERQREQRDALEPPQRREGYQN